MSRKKSTLTRSSPRKDERGVDLLSDTLPLGALWYTKPDETIGYTKFRSRSHDAVIRVHDEAGNVIETHERNGEFREPRIFLASRRTSR